jgi:hypothetical protein
MKRLALLSLFLALPLMAQPHAMLGAALTGGGSSVSLTWTASATPGGTVNVYRCIGANCTSFTLLTSGVLAAGPYTDATITAGAYSYQVTAVVNGAESVPSNTATVTVRPQPPTGLAATTP